MPLPWVTAWEHRSPNGSLIVGRTKHGGVLGGDSSTGAWGFTGEEPPVLTGSLEKKGKNGHQHLVRTAFCQNTVLGACSILQPSVSVIVTADIIIPACADKRHSRWEHPQKHT